MRSLSQPVLIACSHGTRSARGAAAVAALVEAVRTALPSVEVLDTWVDVQVPALPTVAESVADREAVVVPLLLSAGYHVHHDIAGVVARRPGHVAAAPLGPHAAITRTLVSRLHDEGLRPDDSVVLGASASSDPRALADLRATAAELSFRLGRRVELGHVGHCGTPLADVVAGVRRPGRRVLVASHLLAPGHFHDALGRAGADVVTAPLLDERRPDERLVSLVLERYAAACAHDLATAV
ncbi:MULTISPECIES: sirohydrochlorin chelatase [Aeromicrobium]|uniref:sirohydrochlorin chelatase n=1 Tax=Aeromicrobium TaxID=2040 RepID=UPI002580906A|nr:MULTISPECIES: CbiX/SirB N-terminal domain-containing protein [Aeromicrobium]